LQSSINELLAIIGYDGVGISELTHNAFTHEFSNILGRDGGKGLDLYPCGEIIYPDQEEFSLSLAWLKGPMMSILRMANDHEDTMLWSVSGLR